jgi:hypothetical protein
MREALSSELMSFVRYEDGGYMKKTNVTYSDGTKATLTKTKKMNKDGTFVIKGTLG